MYDSHLFYGVLCEIQSSGALDCYIFFIARARASLARGHYLWSCVLKLRCEQPVDLISSFSYCEI